MQTEKLLFRVRIVSKAVWKKDILERPDIDNWKDHRVNQKVVVL